MANYCCTIRTNYFHVKDATKFRVFMSKVYGCEDNIELWEEKDCNGEAVFGFGVYGDIAGVRILQEDDDDDCDDSSYDDFIAGLQECVADDDAIIILEAGNEKMRYVIGSATIITHNDYKYLDITSIAMNQAAEMICNPDWKTKCEY